METRVEYPVVVKIPLTYGWLAERVDKIAAAFDIEEVMPCLAYAGIRIPTKVQGAYMKTYRTISFNCNWRERIPKNWRTHFNRLRRVVIFEPGSEYTLSFTSDTEEDWTDDEIKKVFDILFEVNCEN